MYDEAMGEVITSAAESADTLLLGRHTYETFAASWPQRTAADDPMAPWMNESPKYVVSTTLEAADWNNTTVVSDDVAQQIEALKEQPGKDILVNGSAGLVRTLLREGLLDELQLFVHPTVVGVGVGKKLFADEPAALKTAKSETFGTGVVSLTLVPA